MKVVRFLSTVDETKCVGDRLCENICPTAAIKVVGKKALVEIGMCVDCQRCLSVCRHNAITMVARPEPMIVGTDPGDVDSGELKQLCAKAHLHPQQFICLCTRTRVSEAAAAVLKGAKTPEEITLMTGVRSGCMIYCIAPMLRLLHAHGLELTPPDSPRWYDVTSTLWEVSDEVVKKNPGYYFEEDKEIFRKF